MCAHTTTGPLVLVVAVGATLHLLDLQKGLAAELRADVYFRFPRKATATIRNAITYTVLDVEKTGVTVDRFSMAEVTVARSSDLGLNDEQFVCLSHLGNILHAGKCFNSAALRTFNSASLRTFNSAALRTFNSAALRTFNSAALRTFNSASLRTFNSAALRT
jgi:hypothetical protein